MDIRTKEILDQIIADKQILKKKMVWESNPGQMAVIAAFLFASAGRRADVDRYVLCKKYLKKNVNIFSEVRGISEVITIIATSVNSSNSSNSGSH